MLTSSTAVVVAARGPFQADGVESRFSVIEPTYPPAVERAFALLAEELRERAAAGEDVPYDSQGYRLVEFETNLSALVLSFAPSTYYRMLATNERLDEPLDFDGDTRTLRQRYAGQADLRVRPAPEFATFWSVGVSIVTADGWLLISQRGATALDPDVCGPAVAEGASRPQDADASGAPDQFNVARRGMQEELGLGLAPDELTWLSLCATVDTFHYALIGRVNTELTLSEIEGRRVSAPAADAWETRRLHALELDPAVIARFCADPSRRFSAFGLAAVVQTVLHEFGEPATVSAFDGVPVDLRPHLRS